MYVSSPSASGLIDRAEHDAIFADLECGCLLRQTKPCFIPRISHIEFGFPLLTIEWHFLALTISFRVVSRLSRTRVRQASCCRESRQGRHNERHDRATNGRAETGCRCRLSTATNGHANVYRTIAGSVVPILSHAVCLSFSLQIPEPSSEATRCSDKRWNP